MTPPVVRWPALDPNVVHALAERYTAAWCSREPANVAAFFATEGSLSVNDGAPAVGHAAIAAVAESFMAAFPDLRILWDGLDVGTDGCRYRWTMIGTHLGPEGSGRRLRISGHEDWRLDADGFIVDSRGWFDVEDFERQLNLAAR